MTCDVLVCVCICKKVIRPPPPPPPFPLLHSIGSQPQTFTLSTFSPFILSSFSFLSVLFAIRRAKQSEGNGKKVKYLRFPFLPWQKSPQRFIPAAKYLLCVCRISSLRRYKSKSKPAVHRKCGQGCLPSLFPSPVAFASRFIRCQDGRTDGRTKKNKNKNTKKEKLLWSRHRPLGHSLTHSSKLLKRRRRRPLFLLEEFFSFYLYVCVCVCVCPCVCLCVSVYERRRRWWRPPRPRRRTRLGKSRIAHRAEGGRKIGYVGHACDAQTHTLTLTLTH